MDEEVESLGERLSWRAQSLIRRWTFLAVITLVTALVWVFADPIWNQPSLGAWNLCASYLALFIESVVGIGMYNLGRRDAIILREVRAYAKSVEAVSHNIEVVSRRIEALSEMVYEQTLHNER